MYQTSPPFSVLCLLLSRTNTGKGARRGGNRGDEAEKDGVLESEKRWRDVENERAAKTATDIVTGGQRDKQDGATPPS